MEVGLFVPCYVDQLAPRVGLAAADVLERAGCRVVYDPQQTCCGQPFWNQGLVAEGERLGRRLLQRLSRFESIVCPSASCVATVRHRLGEEAGTKGPTDRAVAERMRELGEFLVHDLGVTDLGARFPHRVALLQSCHGLRELGLGPVTERLLRGVSGLELVSGSRPDECCGFGGAFSVELPEISGRMGRDRLADLEGTGAEFVTATDASCLLHLEGIRRRVGSGPRPIHYAEILASGGPSRPEER